MTVAKVLTVKNPWAELIVAGVKDIENRSWSTQYRGVLWIHSSKVPDQGAWLEFRPQTGPGADVHGHVLGSVLLVDCVQGHRSRWADRGSWHWVLDRPRRLKLPVPARGKMGLWEMPAASLAGPRLRQ